MASADTEAVIFTVLYALTMIAAFSGNMFLIYIVWKKPEVRSLTSFMFVNMAVADLLVTLVVMPYSIAYFYTNGKWPLTGLIGKISCRGYLFIAFITITASILCLTVMAVDKFYAVLYPFRRHLWFRKPKFIIPLVWILSMASMSIAPVVHNLREQTSLCTYNFKVLRDESRATTGVFIYYFVVNYLFPLSTMSILYSITARKLWFHAVPGNETLPNHQQPQIPKKRAVRMLIIIVTVFALCWLPGRVYQLFVGVTGSQDKLPTFVMYLCFWLGHANSAINPWLYIGLSGKINSAASRIMRRKSKSRNFTSNRNLELITRKKKESLV